MGGMKRRVSDRASSLILEKIEGGERDGGGESLLAVGVVHYAVGRGRESRLSWNISVQVNYGSLACKYQIRLYCSRK